MGRTSVRPEYSEYKVIVLSLITNRYLSLKVEYLPDMIFGSDFLSMDTDLDRRTLSLLFFIRTFSSASLASRKRSNANGKSYSDKRIL